jgi:hypothetical protein
MEEPMMSSTPVEDVVPGVLVLAAVDRAERHRVPKVDPPGVPVWSVLEHLATPRRSRRAREVRARLDELVAAGSLERSRRHSVAVWSVTRPGRRRLSRARRAGPGPVLPESPQHRAWRDAQELAGERVEGFRLDVLEELEHAGELLDAEMAVAAGRVAPEVLGGSLSDAWFEVAERLQRACRRLGSASYCLWDWREPEDARADVDDHRDPRDQVFDRKQRERRVARRHGRRNTALWDRDAELVFLEGLSRGSQCLSVCGVVPGLFLEVIVVGASWGGLARGSISRREDRLVDCLLNVAVELAASDAFECRGLGWGRSLDEQTCRVKSLCGAAETDLTECLRDVVTRLLALIAFVRHKTVLGARKPQRRPP